VQAKDEAHSGAVEAQVTDSASALEAVIKGKEVVLASVFEKKEAELLDVHSKALGAKDVEHRAALQDREDDLAAALAKAKSLSAKEVEQAAILQDREAEFVNLKHALEQAKEEAGRAKEEAVRMSAAFDASKQRCQELESAVTAAAPAKIVIKEVLKQVEVEKEVLTEKDEPQIIAQTKIPAKVAIRILVNQPIPVYSFK
jgi:hypothetical protein